MLTTEDEAKGKWCPHRAPPDEHSDITPCLASQCQAWRWGTRGYEYKDPTQSGDTPPGEGWKIHQTTKYWRRKIPREGYCGLAGDPGHPGETP